MYEVLVKLFLGIVLLLISTKILVKLSGKLSSSLKISPLFIGITVVALVTSLPELVVSLIASLRNDIGLAVGNIVGSNIVNILMVFPVGIILGKLKIGTIKTQRSIIILLTITFLFVILHLIPIGNIPLGLFFIALAFLFIFTEYIWAISGRTHEDLTRLNHLKKEKFCIGEFIKLILSIVGIIVGGYLVVISTENLSLITGYSTTVLGLSLTAIASSFPELLTTIFSQEENQAKLTIGDIIGSNIYNLLFIGGVISLISPISNIQNTSLIFLVITTILFAIIVKHFKGAKVPVWVGLLILPLFIFYLYFLSIK